MLIVSMFVFVHACTLSHFQLFSSPWTVAHQVPLFMGLSGKNTIGGYHFLLQRISPTKRSNLHLQHWQANCLCLGSHTQKKAKIARQLVNNRNLFPSFQRLEVWNQGINMVRTLFQVGTAICRLCIKWQKGQVSFQDVFLFLLNH